MAYLYQRVTNYRRRKIKNVVIQQVANFRFYQISNQVLSGAINTQFSAYQTSSLSFPFVVTVIGINIHYPDRIRLVNDTLGVKLLEQQSLLNQLNNQLTQVQTYIKSYQTPTINYATQRGQIEGQMVSR
jgi:hypothetical protein